MRHASRYGSAIKTPTLAAGHAGGQRGRAAHVVRGVEQVFDRDERSDPAREGPAPKHVEHGGATEREYIIFAAGLPSSSMMRPVSPPGRMSDNRTS